MCSVRLPYDDSCHFRLLSTCPRDYWRKCLGEVLGRIQKYTGMHSPHTALSQRDSILTTFHDLIVFCYYISLLLSFSPAEPPCPQHHHHLVLCHNDVFLCYAGCQSLSVPKPFCERISVKFWRWQTLIFMPTSRQDYAEFNSLNVCTNITILFFYEAHNSSYYTDTIHQIVNP